MERGGVNLTERARLQGIHPQTAYRWFRDPDEVDDDLVRGVTEVLTSFCARRYGRRSRNRADKALRYAARDAGPASPRVVP
jgi:predicted site-specific integrase-resolvase